MKKRKGIYDILGLISLSLSTFFLYNFIKSLDYFHNFIIDYSDIPSIIFDLKLTGTMVMASNAFTIIIPMYFIFWVVGASLGFYFLIKDVQLNW